MQLTVDWVCIFRIKLQGLQAISKSRSKPQARSRFIAPHAISLTTSFAFLSSLSPTKRECRRCPLQCPLGEFKLRDRHGLHPTALLHLFFRESLTPTPVAFIVPPSGPSTRAGRNSRDRRCARSRHPPLDKRQLSSDRARNVPGAGKPL